MVNYELNRKIIKGDLGIFSLLLSQLIHYHHYLVEHGQVLLPTLLRQKYFLAASVMYEGPENNLQDCLE